MTGPEQHAATVRKVGPLKSVIRYALIILDPKPSTTQAGLAALDELVAQARDNDDDAEGLRAALRDLRAQRKRAEAAEARADELQRERDEYEQEVIGYQVSSTEEADETHHWRERAEQAEQRASQLEHELEGEQRQLVIEARQSNEAFKREQARADQLEHERDEAQRDFDQSWENWKQARREADQLRAALIEHHAVGALDGTLVGDQCPVCAALAGVQNKEQ